MTSFPFEEIYQTLLAVAVTAAALFIFNMAVKRRLSRLEGYEKLLRLVIPIVLFLAAIYVGMVWKLFSILVGALATIGVIGLVVGFATVPWITDLFVGIGLFLSPLIREGAEIQVAQTKGRIVKIGLTTTLVSGEECLHIVPNKKFREEIVTIYATKRFPR